MIRIYHHYSKWEEIPMWQRLHKSKEEMMLQQSITFTGDAELYGSFMLQVLHYWPISCEHNLSDVTMNRKAWIGHAAAWIGISSPEYITRMAWAYLTKQQQIDANAKADEAIKFWECQRSI